MTHKSEIARKNALFPTAFDNIFEDLEGIWKTPYFCQSGHSWAQEIELVSDFETRLPLCDMEDLGDKYEITLELQAFQKKK